MEKQNRGCKTFIKRFLFVCLFVVFFKQFPHWTDTCFRRVGNRCLERSVCSVILPFLGSWRGDVGPHNKQAILSDHEQLISSASSITLERFYCWWESRCYLNLKNLEMRKLGFCRGFPPRCRARLLSSWLPLRSCVFVGFFLKKKNDIINLVIRRIRWVFRFYHVLFHASCYEAYYTRVWRK